MVGVLPIRIVGSESLIDERPMLETLDYTIRIGSTPTILYFNLYNYYICIILTLSPQRLSLNE